MASILIYKLFFFDDRLAGNLVGNVFDFAIIRFQEQLFSQHPTIFLNDFMNPIVTSVLCPLYFMNVFIGVGFVLFLYRVRRIKLEEYILGFTLLCITSFFIFTQIPTVGPYYFLDYEKSMPSQSPCQIFLDSLTSNGIPPTDAFPSLHVGTSAYVLFYSRKISKKIFTFLFIPTILIWASTSYLQVHYFLDIISGIMLALVFCELAPWLEEKWPNTV